MHHDVLIVAIMQNLKGEGEKNHSPKSMKLPTLPNTHTAQIPTTKRTQKTP